MTSSLSENPRRGPRMANELALVAAILIVVVATAALDSNHSYLKRPGDSIRDIARNTALLGMFALGASVVIISGGIDLSSGSMIAFSGTVCACLMLALAPERMSAQAPVGVAVVIGAMIGTIVVGFLVGTLHAWLITAVRLPPFVATLATLVGLRSLARALCESVTTTMTGAKSSQIYVNDPIFKYLRDNVWVSVVVFCVLAVFTAILLSRTVLGRHIYALGGNEQAARLSGIRTENVKWVAYCFGAITASIAGIFYVANESVAAPVNQGRGHELNAIAAAVVGGCSLQGGIGTVSGTVLGAIFLRVVIDAVAKIIKTGADVYEGFIVGIVVVMAVTFSQLRQLIASGRQLLPGALGICAIPTLALLAGAVCVMTLGRASGLVAGFTTLMLLVALKGWEYSRTRRA
jgi:ribose/xylose/arabinose/galactoside ABC-type transport system permease subunit